LRQALDLAFDYEWTNKNLFFDAYKRTGSFFENSVMRASGTPGADELALLEPLKDKLPESVFGEAYEPPVSNGSGQDRKLLRQAAQLLDAAGWKAVNGVRTNDRGEPLTIEFLIFAPTFERVIAPYVRNLKLLGIDASIRQVEAAQYQERLKSFDFDVLVQRYSMSQTPGVETEGVLLVSHGRRSRQLQPVGPEERSSRCAHRQHHAGQGPRKPRHGGPGTGPGAAG
jgi:microcin C transport system substrate-binding protein